MIEAVIFDMDGLLIDSEPLWREAEVEVFNGIGLPLTEEMTRQTTGMRTDELVQYWHHKHPWERPAQKEVVRRIEQGVIERIKKEGKAMPGVFRAFRLCKESGIPAAIASSSSLEIISTVLKTVGIENEVKLVHSAHHEEFGKPHPAVYISTARQLGVPATHCLAFEDSVNGVLAAKSAKMTCIAIPEPGLRDDRRYGIADRVLNSLEELKPDMLKG